MRFGWLEWSISTLLLLVALGLVLRRWRSTAAWIVVGSLLASTTVGAMIWQKHLGRRTESRRQMIQRAPREERPGGYVKSETCQVCHPSQYASWHRSYHRTMTQFATPETVRGNFSNVTLHLPEETFHLTREGDEFFVEMNDPDWRYVQMLKWVAFKNGEGPQPPVVEKPPRAKKRISIMTGSHHMQAYWLPSAYGNLQLSLPFTYVFEMQRWVPRNDVFLLKPDASHLQQVWNNNCISCHATAGLTRQDPKTKIHDTRAAELGISCEACHGPGEEHIRLNGDPTRRYAMHLAGKGDPSIVNPARLNHIKSSEACGQCHAIRYKPNPDVWNMEGTRFAPGGDIQGNAPLTRYVHYDPTAPTPARAEKNKALMEGCFWPDGQVRVSGRDFSALFDSGCYQRGQISCLSCHSMHQYQENTNQLARGMEGNQACLQCHPKIGQDLEKHTHHRADSSGSLCFNCHMPHTTYGLLKGIRSHTINSPNVKSDLQADRPNACNLCHLDKSLGWTSRHLHEWFGGQQLELTADETNLSAAARATLSGDAGQRAVWAWHFGWKPAREVSGEDWMAPYLAQMLVDPYAVVRYIAGRSLQRLPGYETFAYDYVAAPTEREAARQRAMDLWRAKRPVAALRGAVLIETNGALQEPKFLDLLRKRNDRVMELLE